MKRVWIFVGAGLLLLLLFAWWYSQREWLTDQLLAEIKLGMKKDQVEALLGKPENDYKLDGISFTPPTLVPTSNKPWESASANPWLAAYKSSEEFIRHETTPDEVCIDKPYIWVGRERALVLFLNESDSVSIIQAFSITKTGGGFFSWLSRKWDDWKKGK